VTYIYVLVAVAACVGWLRQQRGAPPLGIDPILRERRAVPLGWVAIPCVVLIAAFVGLGVLEAQHPVRFIVDGIGSLSSKPPAHAASATAHRITLPFPFVLDGRPGAGANAIAFALGVVQTLALAALAALLLRSRGGSAERALLVATAAIMLVLGCVAPTLTTTDLYAYVAFALSASPYQPHDAAWPGEHHALNILFGTPIFQMPYGPLWNIVADAAVRPFGSLAHQLIALRLVGAASFVACILALRKLRLPRAVVACFALDPTFVQLFVVDAHNNVLGLALTLWACAIASFPLAIVLAAAAGCVKMPFALVGAVAFAGRGSRLARCGAFAATLGLTVLVYIIGAGSGVLGGVRASSLTFTPPPPILLVTQAFVGVVALVSLAGCLLSDRWNPPAAWGALAFGYFPLPWYLAGSVPYAVRSGGGTVFLVLVPLVSAIVSRTYIVDTLAGGAIQIAVLGAAIALGVGELRARLARRRERVRLAASG